MKAKKVKVDETTNLYQLFTRSDNPSLPITLGREAVKKHKPKYTDEQIIGMQAWFENFNGIALEFLEEKGITNLEELKSFFKDNPPSEKTKKGKACYRCNVTSIM